MVRASLFQSRNPARDGTAVIIVRSSKLAVEGGLFVGNYKEMGDENADHAVRRESETVKNSGLSDDNQEHPDIHGIAQVTMQSADDEEFCRSNRRRRSKSAHGEFPGTDEVNGSAGNQNQDAEPCQRTVTGRGVSIEQEVRDDYRDGSWHEEW